MKTYILIFFILFVSIIVILKLITSPEPVTAPERPFDMKIYDTGKPTYQYNEDAYYRQSSNKEIDDLKLMAFARAFVDVQSYMHKAGNKAHYNETSKIVQNHGLSVEDYTNIASRMNKNSDFKNKVQKMINEVN
ncbi:MAG: DUF4168 domain-containing protein [Candidatus Scalindua sp.]|nr:DUF4168 domain-containing protein [Candidatus Scalindua sp.]MCR4345014.1 DUF4168 domain-containing protein [Candidatus Scalindua sp.]